MGYLSIITGCMFASKTTKLIQYAKYFAQNDKHLFVINHSFDTRYDYNCEHICSHDNARYKCISLHDLSHMYKADDYTYCDTILIDEAQFFQDLKTHVLKMVEEDNKYVIISGLLIDAQRNKFGELIDLLPFADHIEHLKAKCEFCTNEGIFSMKFISVNNEIIDIGNTNKYISVCRNHYLNKKVDT